MTRRLLRHNLLLLLLLLLLPLHQRHNRGSRRRSQAIRIARERLERIRSDARRLSQHSILRLLFRLRPLSPLCLLPRLSRRGLSLMGLYLVWVLVRRVDEGLLAVDDVLLGKGLLLVVWRSVPAVVGVRRRSAVIWGPGGRGA